MGHHIVSTLHTSLQGNYSHAKCIIVYLYDFHLWADSFSKIISKVCSFIILSTKIHVAYTTRPCSWFCNKQTLGSLTYWLQIYYSICGQLQKLRWYFQVPISKHLTVLHDAYMIIWVFERQGSVTTLLFDLCSQGKKFPFCCQ